VHGKALVHPNGDRFDERKVFEHDTVALVVGIVSNLAERHTRSRHGSLLVFGLVRPAITDLGGRG
jgi:thymidylate synthase ThyX